MEEYRLLPEPFNKYACSNYGNVMNTITRRILKQANHSQGYKVVCLKNYEHKKVAYIHRLIAQLFLEYNQDTPIVDHKNNDKQNNNVYNLRYVTAKQNSYNSRLSRRNKTGVKGVSFYKGRYIAHITHESHRYYLGSFKELELARQARLKASNNLYEQYKNICET